MAKRTLRWLDKYSSRSLYFLLALLFHLTLFMMIATWVVFKASSPPEAIEFQPAALTHVSEQPPTPPHDIDTPILPKETAATTGPISNPISLSASENSPFNVAIPKFGNDPIDHRIAHSDNSSPVELGIEVNPHSPSNPAARYHDKPFPIYLASYANGDWSCNNYLDSEGKIVGGSLLNLAAWIEEESHGKIKGEVAPMPLQIGGTELLDKMPPFIFFTGHKDFVLTDQEVANLQAYLINGGAIWGDNALAGSGSRFDVAFRREMKRVVPNLDKNFEPLPLDHPLMSAKWPLSKIPSGMNYYDEPIEILQLDGRIAIIYTPNDYSDLMTMHFKAGTILSDTEKATSDKPLFTPLAYIYNSRVYYRNYAPESTEEANKLGMNIVTYLLTRFDDILQMGP